MGASKPLGQLQDFFAALAGDVTSFYSSHERFSLKFRIFSEKALQIWQHQPHVVFISFIDYNQMGQAAALALGAFVLEQVILESFAADNLATASGAKTLGRCFASF
jgi:hypothetical protein